MLTILLQAAATPNSGMGQYGFSYHDGLDIYGFFIFHDSTTNEKTKEIKKFQKVLPLEIK